MSEQIEVKPNPVCPKCGSLMDYSYSRHYKQKDRWICRTCKFWMEVQE